MLKPSRLPERPRISLEPRGMVKTTNGGCAAKNHVEKWTELAIKDGGKPKAGAK